MQRNLRAAREVIGVNSGIAAFIYDGFLKGQIGKYLMSRFYCRKSSTLFRVLRPHSRTQVFNNCRRSSLLEISKMWRLAFNSTRGIRAKG